MTKTVKHNPKKMSVAVERQTMDVLTHTDYDEDFYKWTKSQAKLLKNQEFSRLDIENLIEEIESLGKSQRDKLESYLTVLLMHLLKIRYQPEMHTRSWDLSIKNAKYHVKRTLEQNPSLKSKISDVFVDAYYTARLQAAQETNLDEKTFPKESPWSVKDITCFIKDDE